MWHGHDGTIAGRLRGVCLASALAASIVSCDQALDQTRDGSVAFRTPRFVDVARETLVLASDAPPAPVLAREQVLDTMTEVVDIPVRRVIRPAARARSVTSSVAEPELRPEELGPREESEAPTVPAVRPSPTGPRRDQVAVLPAPTPARGDDGLSSAKNVALIVGSLGLVMGSVAASSDGAPGEKAMTISAVTLGVAGFATAGILHLLSPSERAPGADVMLGPGMIGVHGRF